jgi:fructose-bisphosphate aldolase class II
VISECLKLGWNSVLFDASFLPIEENQRQTTEVVNEAHTYGADVEGELESITGVEDGIGSDRVADQVPLDRVLKFIVDTGVDVFAPAIGNAHGAYTSSPELDGPRVTDIVEATNVPIALHGGTGLRDDQFSDLIARGCAKVNISTALKVTFMRSTLEFLRTTERRDVWDPPSLFVHSGGAVRQMAAAHIARFGSKGMAW